MENKKIRVAVSGACGRMGQEVVKAVSSDNDLELVAAIDIANNGKDIGEIVLNKELGIKVQNSLNEVLKNCKIDVVVDFTSPDKVFENTKTVLENNVKPVIGTTGLSEAQLNELLLLQISLQERY